MAVVSIQALKSYFLTGKKPTQQQFENLIDTLQAVQNNVVTIGSGVNQVVIPANTLVDDIVLLGNVNEGYTLKIGTTPNGTDIINNEDLNQDKTVLPLKLFFENQTTLYFTNVPNSVIIKIYKK